MAKKKKARKKAPEPARLTRRQAVQRALVDLGHVDRLRALEACAAAPSSPKDIHDATLNGSDPSTLGTISYHVRALSTAGLIVLDSRVQVRGAIAHYYVLSDAGRTLLESLDLSDDGEIVGCAICRIPLEAGRCPNDGRHKRRVVLQEASK